MCCEHNVRHGTNGIHVADASQPRPRTRTLTSHHQRPHLVTGATLDNVNGCDRAGHLDIGARVIELDLCVRVVARAMRRRIGQLVVGHASSLVNRKRSNKSLTP